MPVNITDFFKGLSLKQAVSILLKSLRCGYVLLSPSLSAWPAHRAASKGAALAYYTLFSITPILVLTIAVSGYFFGAEAAQGEIIAQMQALVGPKGAQAINAAEFAYRFNRRYWRNQAFDRLLYACINADPAPLPVLRA